MPNNKHKNAIRERMAATGENYSTARRNYLAEHDLPPDLPTSRSAAERKEQKIRDEYGEHLGVPEPRAGAATAGLRGGPAVAVPAIEHRRGGRVR